MGIANRIELKPAIGILSYIPVESTELLRKRVPGADILNMRYGPNGPTPSTAAQPIDTTSDLRLDEQSLVRVSWRHPLH